MKVLEIGVPDVGVQTHHSLLKEKLGVVRSLPIVCLGFIARLCLSLSPSYFDVDFFSFSQKVRVTQLVPGFLSE